MKPLPHQIIKADECWSILKHIGIVYLAGLPRSGKTLTSILTAEKWNDKKRKIIVFTKKNAISGWNKFINDDLLHEYTIINYEQASKITDTYDLAIIDEAHNLSTIPKPSQRIKEIRAICYDLPTILLSGTPIVESPIKIFHQCYVTKYSPFKHKNFYAFHREFGVPYSKIINMRTIQFYDKAQTDKLMPLIDEFTVKMTQEDAGISKELHAVDKVHYINLDSETKDRYNYILKYKIITINDKKLICDSVMKLRTSLHMLESGIAKIDDDYIETGNTEKIDYIKKEFGDTEQVGIMSHFIGERDLLKKHFKHAQIYSSNAHSEGVDLSHLKYFIVISSDYSGAKHIQRRERIINMNNINTTTVHFLIVKNAISEQVYKTVSQKLDFNNSCFERKAL